MSRAGGEKPLNWVSDECISHHKWQPAARFAPHGTRCLSWSDRVLEAWVLGLLRDKSGKSARCDQVV